jgi:OmpA-OmpF porin, OOP family
MEKLMKRISGTSLALLAAAACAVSASALADNPVGFYLGAGVGYSTIRSDDASYGLPSYYNDHQTAWKVIAGVRPLAIIGAEFEYIDFGQPGNRYGYNNIANNGFDSHPRAAALFGVGYLPLPVPFFDVYGKAGVARLNLDVTTVDPLAVCPVSSPNCGFSRHSQSDNKFAYGVGVQSKAWGVSFRAEYERISSQYGDPDALTVSATWTF